ncbi:hypothetical protein [Xylophilus sp. GOD-11R]|uniref:hypothetical protein n=1 Tax=Xylophilus sp. GOD-11R TaxID=3089814 RepID=UPI00298D2CD9|nr:hypothetical protein [Xylophilus sp. GOD-11R]WPB55425.1 hypothetical protein R9X41_14890 [Xylophilus sp. GOD-11R]
MAYAAYPHAAASRRSTCATPFVVIDVLAETHDAAEVRHAVSDCADAGVLRCIPLQSGGRVRLQIRCPACEVAHLMHEVMTRTIAAEFGRTATWADHLASYQQSRHG